MKLGAVLIYTSAGLLFLGSSEKIKGNQDDKARYCAGNTTKESQEEISAIRNRQIEILDQENEK
ncbi:MAG: hypothetical protein KAJ23_00460 [Maribacter sp.]|nr:hypothetical protein [Maribacter sp.]